MTKRKRRSKKQRLAIWEAHNGVCWRCKLPINAGEDWHIGHIISLSCGGDDCDENVAPEHASCNMQDAYETTIPKAAKIKRVRAKHFGPKPPPKFRGWRKFNGQVVIPPRDR